MYTWNPRDYHHNSAAQAALAREILDRLDLSPGDRVLDLGCGDGKITAEIAARVPEGFVQGVDGSPDMIAFARESFSKKDFPNLRFVQGRAEEFAPEPLAEDEAFDFVFSNACLHWVENHAAVLNCVRNVLRPGGRFYFQMGGRGNVAELKSAVETVAADTTYRDFFRNFSRPYFFYGPEEYAGWLDEAGLNGERVELVRRDTKQPGRDGVAAYLRTTWMPYTSRVPEELREDFIQSAARAYTERYPAAADGQVSVPMVRLEVVGRR